jgi:hypothetical protein
VRKIFLLYAGKSVQPLLSIRAEGLTTTSQEQTTEEWDWVNLHPMDYGAEIAGRYAPSSNIYQAALVRASLHCLASPPPQSH